MAKESFELGNEFLFPRSCLPSFGFAEYGMQAIRTLRIHVGVKKNQIS